MARDHFGVRLIQAEDDTLRAGAPAPSCFSDEAAIDFPSVDEIVPRVRDRFLGPEHQRTVSVEVSLSPQAARRGTTVPVDVPLWRLCERCGGRGETWGEPCGGCHGVGHADVMHTLRLVVPAGVLQGTRLRLRISPPMAMPVLVEVSIAIGQPLV